MPHLTIMRPFCCFGFLNNGDDFRKIIISILTHCIASEKSSCMSRRQAGVQG